MHTPAPQPEPSSPVALATLLHLIVGPHALEALKTILSNTGYRVNPGLLLGQRAGETFVAFDTVGVQVPTDLAGTPLPMVPDLAYAMAWWSGHKYALAPDRTWRHRAWWVHLDGVGWGDLRPQPQEVGRILTGMTWPTSPDTSEAPELALLVLTTVLRGRLVARAYRINGPEAFTEIDIHFLDGDLTL